MNASARVLTAVLLAVSPLLAAPPAAATDLCTRPAEPYPGRPWALQRVLLDELWQQATGKGVTVAVVDSGVDDRHPQLAGAVDSARGAVLVRGAGADPTVDLSGHGTRVAGVIAARPARGTGFTGLAPGATIVPVRQVDAEGDGDARTLAAAVDHARRIGADVINVSQDTPHALAVDPALDRAVRAALDDGIVVVASAGNDGLGGAVRPTYPASIPGVLAVAAADRNNERAAFSQSGDFVDVAAPGVGITSTVPGGGHCTADGTSFAAPYVAGVAALLVEKHPDWGQERIAEHIRRTAERSVAGRDRLVGWGVVDPVRALTEDETPLNAPPGHEGVITARAPDITPSGHERATREAGRRLAAYVLVGGVALLATVTGGTVALRDARRRRDPRRR
ncbi:type VII secretion-associated serine protease mycosin [Streptomyces sp. NPDC060194]|uniref:type VII secretion-associated serine protease mycosin n=1 Tax=Streptomyces sp. NPDC060194 TaxID=3347069 RepID=UPI0036644596